jgi:flagellar biosynthesis protein FliR
MSGVEALSQLALASLLLALRLGPAFAFAPPFTLTRVPASIRVVLALGLSACMVGGLTPGAAFTDASPGGFVVAVASELSLGVVIALAFQAVFGAVALAGRTVDIQAGYGLATLIDPTTQAQSPLVGTLFAYAAGAAFFAADGHLALLKMVHASLEAIPIGRYELALSPPRAARLLGIASSLALGAAGALVVSLLLADLALAGLSRTAPQMNILILGLQLKSMLLLVVMPLTFGVTAALLARLMAIAIQALPTLV